MHKRALHILVFYLLLALLLASMPSAFARQAPMHEILFTQPDGSQFYGRNIGDQFLHYTVDRDGAILIQDADGWWCYAQFDADNHFISTGVRVGKGGAGIVARVTEIPQALIDEARQQKAQMHPEVKSSLFSAEPLRLEDETCAATLRSQTKAADKSVRGLVLLANFQDTCFIHSLQNFDNMLNQNGYSYAGAVGCAQEYFRSQLGDDVSVQFEVKGPYNLSRPQSYYGENNPQKRNEDKNPAQMIVDVCRLADADVDFSLYDANGDGYIDNVFVFYAGCNEAGGGAPSSIWPHSWYVRSGAGISVTLDGKYLDRYACTSEKEFRSEKKTYMASIGTFCHEFSHTLGLVDLYDTDYGDEDKLCCAGCWGRTALMDAGNGNNNGNNPPNLNAIERAILPNYFPSPILLTEGEHCLQPLSEGGSTYYAPTDVNGEYFLFECRDNTDRWDQYIGGSGLLVYHMDMSNNLTGYSTQYKQGQQLTALERWQYNEVNAHVDYPCGYIVPADASLSLKIPHNDYRSGSYREQAHRLYFPNEALGVTSFSGVNGFEYRSGQASDLSLTNIHMEGKSVCFTVSRVELPPYVTDNMLQSFVLQDSQIFSWKLPEATQAQCYVRFGVNGEEFGSIEPQEVAPYKPGCYAVAFENLNPKTTYKLEIYYKQNELTGKAYSRSFITMKGAVGDGSPFIFLKNVERNADGSFTVDSAFPLRLVNALGAMSVEWYFNGKAVSVDESLLFSPGRSGVLKAVLRDKDGVESVIGKQINIR